MKFHFASGHTHEMPLGNQTRGMCIKGERPLTVELSHKELKELTQRLNSKHTDVVDATHSYLITLLHTLKI